MPQTPIGRAPADFILSGKLAVRDAERGVSLRLRWAQRQDAYDIEVWGPLGQGRTRLQGDAQSMRVTRGDQLLAQGTPEDVMRAQLGWAVPVRYLPAWIRGEPYRPGLDRVETPFLRLRHAELDDAGRFTSFEQANWHVALSRYTAWPAATPTSDAASDATDENAEGSVSSTTPARLVARSEDRKVTLVISRFTDAR